jgi:DNA-directed RNA polymerase beta' subunit
VGQVLEAQMAKVALKTGKTYVTENFDPKVKDWSAHVTQELKKHGLKDTEELIDPTTKLPYGEVMTGHVHFMKLVHQVDKKESARSGMSLPRLPGTEKYDPVTLQPASGGGTGGQSWGQLGMYALLAHGAKGVLRESMTFKSEGEDSETNEAKRWKSQHNDVWRAIQTGQPIPPPRPTYSFHRFTELIKGAGINVEKKGDNFVLSPMTDKQILAMSKGAIKDPVSAVHSKKDAATGEFKPIRDGLFDEKVMGGHGGVNWGHVPLAEPIPHPVFEEPIKKLLGITQDTYMGLMSGKMSVNPITKTLQANSSGLVGGNAFKTLLGKIDVKKELEAATKELSSARSSQVNPIYKKVRYLKALDQLGMKADEAYMLHNLPVMPPKMRPISGMEDGALHYEGINGLYIKFGQINQQLQNPSTKVLPAETLAPYRANLYESVAQIFGTGALPEGAKDRGVLHLIAGTSPKTGFAQKGLLSRRQDASARSTIIPGTKLKFDELGVPKDAAMNLFRPHLVRQMVVQGLARDPLEAQNILSDVHQGKNNVGVDSALSAVLSRELVVAKRDPALHKYSVQAFKPVLVSGKAIQIHPLVVGGFNADFDGDSCLGEVFVVTPQGARTVDLADFPHEEELSKSTDTMKAYRVADDTFVIGEYGNGPGLHRVTEYSVHEQCELWEVTLASGTKIRCSEDHSLTLFDERFLKHVEAAPKSSKGSFVPVAGRMDGHVYATLSLGGEALPANHVLGREIGNWMAQQEGPAHDRAPSRDIEVSDPGVSVPEMLGQALLLPVDFRRGLVYAYLKRRLSLRESEVHASASPVLLAQLLRSVGLFSVEQGGVVLVSASDLMDASNRWVRFGSMHKVNTEQLLGREITEPEIPLPEWIAEEIDRRIIPARPTRAWARENKEKILADSPSPYLAKWWHMVTFGALSWDKVVEVSSEGERVRMYDLTVETAKNFTLTSGHVVWDTMSLQVPFSEQAKLDAAKMLPSHNIFSDSTGSVAYAPSMESQLGIHRMSLVGKDTNHVFANEREVVTALGHKKVELSDKIKVGSMVTTPGRVLLAHEAPASIRQSLLTDLSLELNGKGIRKVLSELGKKEPERFGSFSDKWKDLGYDASTGIVSTSLHPAGKISVGAHSFKMSDFVTDTATRDPILNRAHAEVAKIRTTNVSEAEKDRLSAEAYLRADKQITKDHFASAKSSGAFNSLRAMTTAGIKPSESQYKQILLAPMVMTDSKGRLIATPVDKSYSEGLDVTGYTIQQYGARAGAVKKVQEVQEPGYMTKLLQNVAMDKLIDAHDCGTSKGTMMSVLHSDITDRHLLSPLKVGNVHLSAGQVLTKDLIDHIRKQDPKATLHMRSPIHCHSEKGVCQKCYGLDANGKHPEVGTNIGVLGAHALGERAVQLTLKAFHSGGTASAGGGALGAFGRLEQLTYLPETFPNSAVHARADGKITKIEEVPTGARIWVGDTPHFVGRDDTGHGLHKPLSSALNTKAWNGPKVGDEVKAGHYLTDPNRTLLNPHRYYEATGSMDKVQEVLAHEIHSIYESEGVRKRAVEVVVKGMGNLTRIEDAKDHPDLLRGQHYARSTVEKINRERLKEGKAGITHEPVLRGVNMLPLSATEDWMARLNHQRLRETMMEGAAQNWKSDIHGRHPIPGLMYGAEFGKPSQDLKNKGKLTFY